MPGKRMIETNITEEDVKIEGSLRPQTLDDYIGQSKVKENLKIYIEAAKRSYQILGAGIVISQNKQLLELSSLVSILLCE